MNWIILIIAGFCETGFAFCLGKTKLAVGTEYWLWISGFALLYVLSAVLIRSGQASGLSAQCFWVFSCFTSLPHFGEYSF